MSQRHCSLQCFEKEEKEKTDLQRCQDIIIRFPYRRQGVSVQSTFSEQIYLGTAPDSEVC